MHRHERTSQALYWTAVSLIVCEQLPLDEAARRMGIDDNKLRAILHRHQSLQFDPGWREASRHPTEVGSHRV